MFQLAIRMPLVTIFKQHEIFSGRTLHLSDYVSNYLKTQPIKKPKDLSRSDRLHKSNNNQMLQITRLFKNKGETSRQN